MTGQCDATCDESHVAFACAPGDVSSLVTTSRHLSKPHRRNCSAAKMRSAMEHLTPKQIVAELDKYIVGQGDAKRAVAIAIRNRWRRQQLAENLRADVSPKNILMMGPTGVGKTEIARRLAALTGAPFIKVEATKFTEVGYHGRDVESMVRDLVDAAIVMLRAEMSESVRVNAESRVEERLLDLLFPGITAPSFG